MLLAGDRPTTGNTLITGPYARLLQQAADLGPARADRVKLNAALRRSATPRELQRWARANDLSLRWRDGDDWAVLEGSPAAIAGAFGVPVHDYRILGGPDAGRVFYASSRQPEVPRAVRGEVAGVGRILGYLPSRESWPLPPPLDVPDGVYSPTSC